MEPLVAPVYRSLLFPPLVFGMPRRLFLLIAVSSLAIVVSLGQLWFLIITVATLFGGRAIGKIDRYAFEIFTELLRLPPVAD